MWTQTVVDVIVVSVVSSVVVYVGWHNREVELEKVQVELEARSLWMDEREAFETVILAQVEEIIAERVRSRYTSEDHKRFAEELQLRNSSLDVPDWDSIKD